ncbi:MAG: hypothetical protein AAB574_02930 [Patescibacteria group bacterium]
MKISLVANIQRPGEQYRCILYPLATIREIARSIEESGHTVQLVNASWPTLKLLLRLKIFRPDLIINLAEGLSSSETRLSFFPELYEYLKIPFIGSSANCQYVSLNKDMAKYMVSQSGIKVPKGYLVRQVSDIELALRFFEKEDYPLFIKPNFEGDSDGIHKDSVIQDPKQLKSPGKKLLLEFPQGILVEEFIEGKDIEVGYIEGLGEGGVIEPTFVNIKSNRQGEGKFTYAMYEHKNYASKENYLPGSYLPRSVIGDEKLRTEVIKQAKKCFDLLGVSYFSRIDFRLGKNNSLFFLENNPTCSLKQDAALFYVAEQYYGMSYPEVLDYLIKLCCRKNGLKYRNGKSFIDQVSKKAVEVF